MEYIGSFSQSDMNSLSDLIFNQASTIERLTQDNQLIDQKLLYTHKWNKQEVFLLSARFLQEETPQYYFNNQFLFGEIIEAPDTASAIDQSITNTMQFFGGLASGNNTYYFSDLTAMYNTPNKKFRFSLSGKNLFNTRTFTNFSISDISTTTTSFRLLPRIILASVDFKF